MRSLCGFIKNDKNIHAISTDCVQQVLLHLQSSDTNISEIAIETMCILLERYPYYGLRLISTKVKPVDMFMKNKKKGGKNEKKMGDTANDITLMTLLFDSCNVKLSASRAAAVNPERIELLSIVENRLSRLVSLVIASPPPLPTIVSPPPGLPFPQTEEHDQVIDMWIDANVNGFNQLLKLVLSLAQSKLNTSAATLSLRSLITCMLASSKIRVQICSGDFLPNYIVPLLRKLKDDIYVIIELLTLISVIGGSSPGEEFIGKRTCITFTIAIYIYRFFC
jgi:hypothetical protein